MPKGGPPARVDTAALEGEGVNFDIFWLLSQDGFTLAAIYTLLSLGYVLIFTVTRIIFAAYGDLITISAMTLHWMQEGRVPPTAYAVIVLSAFAAVMRVWSQVRQGRAIGLLGMLGRYGLPIIPAVVTILFPAVVDNYLLSLLLTVLLVTPIGPYLYEIVFEKIARASSLILLIVSLAIHFVLSGSVLVLFGAEGIRNKVSILPNVTLAGLPFSGYALTVTLVAALTCLALYASFSKSLLGKSLRATADNPAGASIVGINPSSSASRAFAIAAFIAAVVGVFLSSNLTIYYDSGMMIGLKGFVGAVFGGFSSYPISTLGAYFLGFAESFFSFEFSKYKDALVFALVLPVVVARAAFAKIHVDDEAGEEI